MSGFVRKFGKAKTFSNLVVRFQEIFFETATSTNPILLSMICQQKMIVQTAELYNGISFDNYLPVFIDEEGEI
jgi:hypothetical protein